jgi:hypothetical protein
MNTKQLAFGIIKCTIVVAKIGCILAACFIVYAGIQIALA